MEMIFKVCLIIADVIVVTVTDSKISKIFGVLAMCAFNPTENQ